MADLLTLATLAKWTQNDAAEVAADELAVDLIAKVSALACFVGGHDGTKVDSNGDPIPEWDLVSGPTMAPIDVQMVVLQVCKRSYENPGRVVQESIGPLSSRVADTQALFAEFTADEREVLAKYNVDGDPTPGDGGTIFTIQTTRGDETTMPDTPVLYVSDNQQPGLAESADPRPWMIPLFNPSDPF